MGRGFEVYEECDGPCLQLSNWTAQLPPRSVSAFALVALLVVAPLDWSESARLCREVRPVRRVNTNYYANFPSSRVVLSRRGRGSGWAVVVVLPGALRKRCNQRRPLQAPEEEVQSGLYTTRYERKLHTKATMGVPFETLIPFAIMLTMFGITGAGLSKVRAMQNGGKRGRHSVDQWDSQSTNLSDPEFYIIAAVDGRNRKGILADLSHAIAPPGFELNNPWRLEKKFR
ncbi:hypothetical protein V501_02903 [Pseudogymnoascus sp. VKM F-4519 (FW-2642)]|nr:hypothetical protein V501_02903 [Pseudogymnoascus sp. VKM F-4519 (FW-2642)]